MLYIISARDFLGIQKGYIMSKTIQVRYEEGLTEVLIDSFPDMCPLCNIGIDPRLINGVLTEGHFNRVELVFQCPRSDCLYLFIGYYYLQHQRVSRDIFVLHHTKPTNFLSSEFGDIIRFVSEDFINIYNQSEQAEKLGLVEIAGPGFRKSLEFLIKDYVTLKKPDKQEEVKKSLLGSIIASNIDDARIQTTAKRAAWLGNDETHYYRKWENRDIKDLKILIKLTVSWIESVQLTR